MRTGAESISEKDVRTLSNYEHLEIKGEQKRVEILGIGSAHRR